MKLLKTHPFLSLVNSYVIDSPAKSSGKRLNMFYIISVVVAICLFLVFVNKVVIFLDPLFFNIVESQFVYSSFVPFMISYKVEIRSSKILGINSRLYNTQSEDSYNLKGRKDVKYKVSKIQKDSYKVSSELNQAIIGLSLGDLFISKRAINAYNIAQKTMTRLQPFYSTIELTIGNLNLTDIKLILKNELRNKSGIYGFVCKSTNKLYIGSSIDLGIRFSAHIKGLRSNIKLQNAINKYNLQDFFL